MKLINLKLFGFFLIYLLSLSVAAPITERIPSPRIGPIHGSLINPPKNQMPCPPGQSRTFIGNCANDSDW